MGLRAKLPSRRDLTWVGGAALAALLVFAMVMSRCGGDDGGSRQFQIDGPAQVDPEYREQIEGGG